MKSIPKPKFAPLYNPNSISGFVDHRVQSQRWLYTSVLVFVSIRGKICPPQLRNWKMGILHTSTIGNLLPVCLRNNRHLADHISERYTKFYGKWKRIAHVIVLDRVKSIPKPKFAPLYNPNSISGFVDHWVQSQRWLVISQFEFLWRSVGKYVHTIAKLPKSDFAHL